MAHDFTSMLYNRLSDIAGELTDILTEFPDGLPDSVCASGEVADAEKVKAYLKELLRYGEIGEVENLLIAAEYEADEEDAAAEEEDEENDETEDTDDADDAPMALAPATH